MSHVSLRWTFLGLAPTFISNRCLLRKVDCMLLLIVVGRLLASILAGFVPLVSQFGLLSATDSLSMYSASQNGHVMDIEDVDITKTVADPGEGPRGPRHPHFRTKVRPEGLKKYFWETGRSPYLRVWITPPPPPFSN